MKQLLKYTGYVMVLLIAGFLIWRFSYIIVWILIAAVLSFIVQPLVRFLDRLHIWKLKIPHSVSSIISLAVVILTLIGLLAIFVPLIVSQAETISKIDVGVLMENLKSPLDWLDTKLHVIGAIPEGQNIQDFLILSAKTILDLGNVGSLVGDFINTAGSISLGFFSILFIAFFFLKDENMFEEMLLLFIPEKHHESTRKVVAESKNLLIRYFIGILLEVIGVMSLNALGLWIFGIKNALLIGFFAGVMNIIPYLGPAIGSVIGITLGVTTTLATGSFSDLLPAVLKIAGVLSVVNFIDNNILVPVIYSKSVKSHPLEIFLVIIMGGGLGGFLGMLFAVPVYTLLRVIAKEFFNQFRLVRKLTDRIE